MKYHLIFSQRSTSPYYVGDEKISSLAALCERTLSGMDIDFRIKQFEIPQVIAGRILKWTLNGFIIESERLDLLSVVFGVIAKAITVDQTQSYPVVIYPEGLSSISKVLEDEILKA